MSMPTITVTGALMVLSILPSASAGLSLAFASGDFTNTKRAGLELAEVGAHSVSSTSCLSRASSTGFGSQALWVRAVRNNWSNAESESIIDRS